MKISVRVHTKAVGARVEKDASDTFHVYVKELPHDGKANEAIVKELAKYFKTAKSNVTIIKGKTAKMKIVDIVW